MSSVRFYPRTYDSVDTDGHSNSDTDDLLMSNARFYRSRDSHGQTCYSYTTGHCQNMGHDHLKL